MIPVNKKIRDEKEEDEEHASHVRHASRYGILFDQDRQPDRTVELPTE
jgi:hypothetical protein